MGNQIMKSVIKITVLLVLAHISCLAQVGNDAIDVKALSKSRDRNAVEMVQSSSAKLERMPESLEVRYALSAAPPHLRESATTYVLDPSVGYVLNHKGTNGVSCLVVRTDWQFVDREFRDDIIWAVCFDAEGSKTLMQDYVYAAELRAKGVNAKDVYGEVTKRFGTPGYPNPARVGIAYMIEPIIRTVFSAKPEPATMNMPHYMFYAPNVKNADIGGKPLSQYPFMLSMSPGRDDFIIMMVGENEKAAILESSKDLLNDLCAYRKYLCPSAVTPIHLTH